MTERDEPTPTLYEWAGGQPAIRRLMDCFYDRVERDDLLGPRFFPDGVHEQHRAHVTTWWSEVFRGPARYTDELGRARAPLGLGRGAAFQLVTRTRRQPNVHRLTQLRRSGAHHRAGDRVRGRASVGDDLSARTGLSR